MIRYPKTCPICGKEFQAMKHQTYCNSKCTNKANRRSYDELYALPSAKLEWTTCPDCGKHYRSRNAGKYVFCRECRSRHLEFGIVDTIIQEHKIYI